MAKANRILQTGDRRMRQPGDRILFRGGKDNGAEQQVVESAMPEYDLPRAKHFRIVWEVGLPHSFYAYASRSHVGL